MIKFLLRIFFISIAVIIFIFYAKDYHPFDKNDYQRIIDNNQITIAVRFGPTSYYQIKDKEIGYTFEIMELYAKYLNVKLNIVTIDDLDKAVEMLNNRDIDILADMGTNQDVKLSYPYHKVDQYLIYNKKYNNQPLSISELINKKIEIIDSHIIKNNLEIFLGDNVNFTVSDRKNIDELIHSLKDNNIDFTIINSDELHLYQKYYPEFEVAFKIKKNVPLTWAIPKNTNNLLEKSISAFFTEMLKVNKLSLIYKKYFSDKLQYTFVGTRSFLNDLVTVFPLYEFYFKTYAKEYNHDWKLLASIGYQESRWDKDAVSYTGVRGLMMLTKDTSKHLGIKDRTNPKESIQGGSKYLRELLGKIPENIPKEERLWFAIASYNIGFGHVEDAIALAKKNGVIVNDWTSIEPFILKLSQSKYYKQTKYGYARGWETVKYVQNIRQYYDILVFLDSQDNVIDKEDSNNKIPGSL